MLAKSSMLLRLVGPRVLSRTNLNRNIGSSSAVLNAAAGPTDPIQKLFADKVILNYYIYSYHSQVQFINY